MDLKKVHLLYSRSINFEPETRYNVKCWTVGFLFIVGESYILIEVEKKTQKIMVNVQSESDRKLSDFGDGV